MMGKMDQTGAIRACILSLEEKAENSVKNYFNKRISEELIADGTPRNLAEYYADKLILHNAGVYYNARGNGYHQEKSGPSKWANRYQGLMDRSFFFCSFPTEHGDPKNENLTLAQESDARNFQFNNMSKIMNIDKYDGKTVVRRKVFLKYSDFLQSAHHFIKEFAMNTKISQLIFNGHGDKKGFRFEGEAKSIPWDRVTKDIDDIIKRVKGGSPHIIHDPFIILVYAQCFAHSRTITSSDHDFVKLVYFTNDSTKHTRVTRQFHYWDKKGEIVDSDHHALNAYGHEQKKIHDKTKKQAGRRRKRHNSGSEDHLSHQQYSRQRSNSVGACLPSRGNTTLHEEPVEKPPNVHLTEKIIRGNLKRSTRRRRTKRFKKNPPQDFTGTTCTSKYTGSRFPIDIHSDISEDPPRQIPADQRSEIESVPQNIKLENVTQPLEPRRKGKSRRTIWKLTRAYRRRKCFHKKKKLNKFWRKI